MLYKAKDNRKLESIAGTTIASGDTSPIGTTVLYDGEEVPTGWQEIDEIYSNPNLLINSNFRNPVNQRGFYEYNGFAETKYTIDRWCVANATLTVLDNNIKLTTTFDKGWLTQFVELNLINKDVCASFFVNGKKHKYALTVDTNYEKCYITEEFKLYVRHNEARNVLELSFEIGKGMTLLLEWIKLEQGLIVTPFLSKLYAEELMLCQRYGRPIYLDYTTYVSSNLFSVRFSKEINMKIAPAITILKLGDLHNIKDYNINVYSYSDHIVFHYSALDAGMTRVFNRKYWLDAEIY